MAYDSHFLSVIVKKDKVLPLCLTFKCAQKYSMKSRQSSQLSLLQAPVGTSITEVDEGRSTFTRTPSIDTSNPSSRATSPMFYIIGSPNPRSDRSTPQRMSSTDKEDTPMSFGHLRKQAALGEDLTMKAPTFDEREESEVSPEVDSPSFHQQRQDKDQDTGGATSTLDSTVEDSSTTLVKSGGALVLSLCQLCTCTSCSVNLSASVCGAVLSAV